MSVHGSNYGVPIQRRPPGFGPPELTDNEVAWVEFLRMICNGRDIGPTLPGEPCTPSSRYRSCQRQTVGFDMPVRRMISTVP
jgi:hypothetical protein